MKKKIIFGIVILLLILGLYMYYIYNIKGNSFETNNKETTDEVSMVIKEGTLTSATIVINNASNEELRITENGLELIKKKMVNGQK